LIIGCSGSGKSTLAAELGEITGLPVIHLDKLFFRKDWVSVSESQFDTQLQTELNKDRWIIDGNYNRTLHQRLSRCDTVIYLDFNRLICLRNVLKRVWRYKGTTRPDMGEGCPEKIDSEFIKWIWNFNGTYREAYHKIFRGGCGKAVYIIHSHRQTARFKKQAADFYK